ARDLLAPPTPDPAALEPFEARAEQHERDFYLARGPLLLTDLVSDFAALQRVMRMVAAPDSSTYYRYGCRILAVLAGLIGLSTVGLGAYEEAAGWYRTGRTAARRAGDRRLESWTMTHHAFALLLGDRPAVALHEATH